MCASNGQDYRETPCLMAGVPNERSTLEQPEHTISPTVSSWVGSGTAHQKALHDSRPLQNPRPQLPVAGFLPHPALPDIGDAHCHRDLKHDLRRAIPNSKSISGPRNILPVVLAPPGAQARSFI
jgi:hypothetical protein